MNQFKNKIFSYFDSKGNIFLFFLFVISFSTSFFIFLVLAGYVKKDLNQIELSSFLLLNFFIVVLISLLTFFKVKGLWLLRKTKRSASNLHIQFSTLFGFLTLIPSVIVTLFSIIFFDQGVNNWFNSKVKTAIAGSEYISESYFKEHSNNLKNDLVFLSKEINNEKVAFFTNKERLTNLLKSLTSIKLLDEIIIFERSGQLLAKIGNSFVIEEEPPPPLWTIFRADDGEISIFTNEKNDKVRGLIKLDRTIPTYLYAGKTVDSLVISRLNSVNSAANEYFDVQKNIKKLQNQFYQLFIVINFSVILLSIWFGLLFANKIIFPIKTIILASEKISQGNLKTRIQKFSKFKDFNILSDSLNGMVDKLLEQKNKLFKAKEIINSRRKFTEEIIDGVNAGIIYTNEKFDIILCNKTSQKIFKKDLIKKNLGELFPEMSILLNQAFSKKELIEDQFKILTNDKVKILNLKINPQFAKKKIIGYLLNFDDITELVSAQKKAAWSNVARYLAHEIKNPLTPIKISTQRIQSNFNKSNLNKDIFENCTNTIIRQVDDIEKLVTEFSEFARMPKSIFSKVDICNIVIKQIESFKIINKNLHFNYSCKFKNLFINSDKSQLNRLFTNIIKNAIESPKANNNKIINIKILKNSANVNIIIEDNGEGFSFEKDKLFEPYITNKTNGTGLGLSICKKIIEEHYGEINLFDSKSLGGAGVEIILPIKNK